MGKLVYDPKYTKRFNLYAQSQNLSPAEVLARDDKLYSGGKMCGFILWHSRHIKAFKRISPESFEFSDYLSDHDAFNRYLTDLNCMEG